MILNTNTLLITGQTLVVFSTLILTDIFFYYEIEINGRTALFEENYFLENLQVFLLFITGSIYSRTVFYVQKEQRLAPIAGALFCLSCILRELDIEKFDVPDSIVFFGSGYGRNTLLISLWLLLTIFFFRNYKRYQQMAANLLTSGTGVLATMGGLLLIVGSLYEDQVFIVKHYAFYEELSELNGYFFILLSSLHLFRDLQRNTNKNKTAELFL